jgi:hypothetical protein
MVIQRASLPSLQSPVFRTTMSSFFNAESVSVLVDSQVGISTIALPLAPRWRREVDVGERMQGIQPSLYRWLVAGGEKLMWVNACRVC